MLFSRKSLGLVKLLLLFWAQEAFSSALTILATNRPLYHILVDLTTGTHAKVRLLHHMEHCCCEDENPLTLQEIKQLKAAGLVLWMGEERLERLLHKEDRSLRQEPHFWLSPAALLRASSSVVAALCKADPQNARFYKENLAQFRKEIEAIAQRNGKRFAAFRKTRFMATSNALTVPEHTLGWQLIWAPCDAHELSKRSLLGPRKALPQAHLILHQEDNSLPPSLSQLSHEKICTLDPLMHAWKKRGNFSAFLEGFYEKIRECRSREVRS